jgi:hypothetical protein
LIQTDADVFLGSSAWAAFLLGHRRHDRGVVLMLRDEAVDQADCNARVGMDLSRESGAYVETN